MQTQIMSKILVYVPIMNFSQNSSDNRISWVDSPVACLSAATQYSFDLIAAIFTGPLKQQQELVELCIALKTNRHCSGIPFAALVTHMDRKLFELLEGTRIDYLKRIQWPNDSVYNALQELTPFDRPSSSINQLCPYIYYQPISTYQDLIVCAAYRYRMVLGSRRLHQFCETSDHVGCPYFLTAPENLNN